MRPAQRLPWRVAPFTGAWIETGKVGLDKIARVIHMLNRQMEHQEEIFKEEGGFREKLSGVRIEARAKQEGAPECLECGKPMTRRKARSGKNVGGEFWGCTGYPECTGTREVEKAREST